VIGVIAVASAWIGAMAPAVGREIIYAPIYVLRERRRR
jgi:hypothetical protein